MTDKRDVVAEQLEELRQDLRDLWVALTVDPKKQARKERMWMILAGAFGAVATMAARKLATRIWTVLTGEPPPPVQAAERQAAETKEPVRH
jgi:hypothetical protein